jgi:hypothetical protein
VVWENLLRYPVVGPETPYERQHPRRVAYQEAPSTRLTSRMRALGSRHVLGAFNQTLRTDAAVPSSVEILPSGATYILVREYFISRGVLAGVRPRFLRRYQAFLAQSSASSGLSTTKSDRSFPSSHMSRCGRGSRLLPHGASRRQLRRAGEHAPGHGRKSDKPAANQRHSVRPSRVVGSALAFGSPPGPCPHGESAVLRSGTGPTRAVVSADPGAGDPWRKAGLHSRRAAKWAVKDSNLRPWD